jgi:hypothetical protein
MRYTSWIVSIYELVDDLQTLWRLFSAVSSIPLPMTLFMALCGCLYARRYDSGAVTAEA